MALWLVQLAPAADSRIGANWEVSPERIPQNAFVLMRDFCIQG